MIQLRNITKISIALALMYMISSCETSQIDMLPDCSAEGPSLQLLATISECDVPTGSVVATPSGGVEPYTFTIDAQGGLTNSSGIFEGIAPGVYSVTLEGANGCSVSKSISVGSDNGPSITSVNTTAAGCGETNGSISVSATGGTGTLSFSLDGGAFQNENSFAGLDAGMHLVQVEDASGCNTQQNVRVLSGVSLVDEIQPIIDANCAVSGCHNGSQFPDLTTLSAIIGNANNIRTLTASGAMPEDGTLSQDHIDMISCWVIDGAINN